MNLFYTNYINNFKGFSKEIWILTLVTFINRAGAMVMLFLTKYLHDELYFNLNEIGYMYACIGLGAITGNFIGGKLTDKFGYYTILLLSQFLTGFGIISLIFLNGFTEICIGLFVVTLFADSYKPAMYIAVSNFSTTKNRTRALTLVRLAVNLGIVTGPVIGGLVLHGGNYQTLFWIDGLTCVISISLFMMLIDESKIYIAKKIIIKNKKLIGEISGTIQLDKNYIIFIIGSFLTAILFFQLFTTIPLYNSNTLKLSEVEIGILLALNGLLIFLFEMPLIGYLEKKKVFPTKIILNGAIFMTLGFFTLLLYKSIAILVISISLITLGQMLLFSFSNSFAFTRAKTGHEGKYMAFYAMSFSAAQIISPSIGLKIIDKFSYFSNWFFMACLGCIGILIYHTLNKNISREKKIAIFKN